MSKYWLTLVNQRGFWTGSPVYKLIGNWNLEAGIEQARNICVKCRQLGTICCALTKQVKSLLTKKYSQGMPCLQHISTEVKLLQRYLAQEVLFVSVSLSTMQLNLIFPGCGNAGISILVWGDGFFFFFYHFGFVIWGLVFWIEVPAHNLTLGGRNSLWTYCLISLIIFPSFQASLIQLIRWVWVLTRHLVKPYF